MTTAQLPVLPVSLIPHEVAPPCHKRVEEEPPTSVDNEEEIATMTINTTTVSAHVEEEVLIDLVDHDDIVVASSAPSAETLNNTMSLKQLKDRCAELNLSTIGKKMELAQRIVDES